MIQRFEANECNTDEEFKQNSDEFQRYLDEARKSNAKQVHANPNRPGPDENKLKEILERTGYSNEVSSGQRKYGGPPPDWNENTPAPGHGCEVSY